MEHSISGKDQCRKELTILQQVLQNSLLLQFHCKLPNNSVFSRDLGRKGCSLSGALHDSKAIGKRVIDRMVDVTLESLEACLGLPLNFSPSWNPQGQYANNIICNLNNTSSNPHTRDGCIH